jgi:signal transduction histidine kinase
MTPSVPKPTTNSSRSGLPLRRRISRYAALWTVLLISAFAALIYVRMDSILHESVDLELRTRILGLAERIEWEEAPDIDEPDSDDSPRVRLAEVEGQDRYEDSGASQGTRLGYEVWQSPSELVYRSRSALQLAKPDSRDFEDVGLLGDSPRPRYETSPDEAFRYVSLTVVPQAKQGESLHPEARPILIRTASSLTRVQDELEGIAVEIAILLAGAVVVVTLLSQRLAQHLLLPLRQLSEQAAAIRPGEAPSTMPNRGTGDELDRLAQTLDSSFAELHDALERQSRFSANAAHELRNPVAALLSSSEVALRRDRPAEEYPPFLIDIVRDAKRMQRIVEALLQLTRLRQRGSPEGLQDIELGPFVEDVIAELGHAARVQLRVEGRPHVPADPELLRILLQNLLHNAAQHGAPATPIRVTVLAAESPDSAPFLLEIRNEQQGLDPSVLTELTEHFVRGPNAQGPGAGLGIALAQELARTQQLTLTLTLDGSEFCARLVGLAPGVEKRQSAPGVETALLQDEDSLRRGVATK